MKKNMKLGLLIMATWLVLAGCASMILVSIDNESVTGPSHVRQFGTIRPSDIAVYGFYKDESRKQVNIRQSDIVFDSRRPGTQTVNIRTSVSAVSFQTEVMALSSLTIASQPTKTLYKIGEDANHSWPGLEVRGEWDQMGSDRIDLASCQITGFNKDQVGRQTIRVAYEGVAATFNVEVVPLTSLAITSQPTKILFKVGEDANASWPGLEIQGTWNQIGTEKIPTASCQITGFNKDQAGRQTIRVAYGGQAATFTVDVLALTGLDLEKPPNKTEYAAGEQINLAGIILYGNYGTGNNRIRELIPENQLTISGYDSGRIGRQQRVTVTVRGQSVNFFVDVVAAPVTPPPTTTSNTHVMVFVPGGTFEMGKNLGTGGGMDATPVHRVTLSGFHIGKHEVTQGQWQMVMGTTIQQLQTAASGGNFDYGRSNDRPVYWVNWYDALVFCNKLSIREGLTPAYRINNSTNPDDWGAIPSLSNTTWDAVTIVSGSTGYRLPTEAQWEYAAKGGNPTAAGWVGYTYAGSDTIDEVAWHRGNNGSYGTSTYGSKVVGTKAANRLGLYDMSGNVWEWCWDWSGKYTSEAQTDPTSAPSGSERVIRGGEWNSSLVDSFHSATRYQMSPYKRNYWVGFRLVRPAN